MVIIPGFGAFISEYRPAEINEENDEIKPPSSRLIFNPQIRNNDGLLVGYVADALRCSHFEALQKIEKERDDFIYRLDKGEKVELKELGMLFYNEKNEVGFTSEEEKNLSLESFGLETTSLKEDQEEQPEETTVAAVQPQDTAAEESQVQEETVQEPEEQQQETENQSQEAQETVEEEEEAEEKEEVAPVVSAEVEAPSEEKKKKRGWIWLVVILLPLIAVSVYILMKDKGTNTPVSPPPQTVIEPEKEEPVSIVDSTLEDTIQISVQDSVIPEEVEPMEQEVARSEGPKFYLVGGSFKEKENAESYMVTLREKGFDPFDMGMYGDFYIIGLGTYNSEEEALDAKSEMLERNPDSGIWVLER